MKRRESSSDMPLRDMRTRCSLIASLTASTASSDVRISRISFGSPVSSASIDLTSIASTRSPSASASRWAAASASDDMSVAALPR